MNNIKYIAIYATLALLSIIVIGQYKQANASLIDNKYHYALVTCNAASADITSSNSVIVNKWQACYNAEKITNTEYICTLHGDNCWLEVK